MKQLLVLAFLAVGLFFSPADAAAPEPMHITGSGYNFSYVEQQGWIINDTGCSWDADDRAYVTADGGLQAGQSFTLSHCYVQDWVNHLLGFDAWSTQPFTIKVEIASAVSTHTITWKPNAKNGRYYEAVNGQCALTPRFDRYDGPDWPSIGTYGGVGYPATITWTITNDGRRVRDAHFNVRLVVPHSGHLTSECGYSPTTEATWDYCVGSAFTAGRVCWADR